jgi:hypothetical protein
MAVSPTSILPAPCRQIREWGYTHSSTRKGTTPSQAEYSAGGYHLRMGRHDQRAGRHQYLSEIQTLAMSFISYLAHPRLTPHNTQYPDGINHCGRSR